MAPAEDKTSALYPETASPPLMISVEAPATLPGGYTFEAEINRGDSSRTFTVEVPEGGVTEGETFLAPLPANIQDPRLNAPTGHWKDGLFDCCSAGFCHASLWCAICCPQILMGQIMSRMQLTWLGSPGPVVSTKYTFKIVLILVVCYFIYATALEIASMPYDDANMPNFLPTLKTIGSLLFTVWALYSLCRTRESVRERYSINEERCAGCEDLCCSFWCSCCTVAQLARHTGEYETYPGVCCSDTGHPKGTPLTV